MAPKLVLHLSRTIEKWETSFRKLFSGKLSRFIFLFHYYQLCSGYIIALHKGTQIRHCVSRGKDELYQNNHDNNPYNDICKRNVDKLMQKYVRTILTIVLSMSIANVGPMYVYYMYGDKVTLTALKIPLVDEGSDLEFACNCAIQIFYGLFFFSANISIEGVALLYGDAISLPSKLIKLSADNLTKKMESNVYTNKHIKSHLLTIFRQIHRVDLWIKIYVEAAYWRYLLSPIVFTYAIGLCVYCQFVVSLIYTRQNSFGFITPSQWKLLYKWCCEYFFLSIKLDSPAGYSIAVLSYILLFLMCNTGEICKRRVRKLLLFLLVIK